MLCSVAAAARRGDDSSAGRFVQLNTKTRTNTKKYVYLNETIRK